MPRIPEDKKIGHGSPRNDERYDAAGKDSFFLWGKSRNDESSDEVQNGRQGDAQPPQKQIFIAMKIGE